MKYAIIDIGSNSIRLTVYRHDEEDGQVYIQFKDKVMAGLAGYVEDGDLSEKGIRKACDALKIYRKVLGNLAIEKIYPFATASLRNVGNARKVLDRIKSETGFEVDIISGEEEAVLDFIGATKVVNIDRGMLVDIGGGSTEIVLFKDGNIECAHSIPVGSLNMYKKHVKRLLPSKEEKRAITKDVKKEIEKLNIECSEKQQKMCGVGGTLRAARKLGIEITGRENADREVDASDVKKVMKVLEGEEKETIDRILRVVPERIHTILPGMIILSAIIKHFEAEQIYVSSYGAREGYLYKNVLRR